MSVEAVSRGGSGGSSIIRPPELVSAKVDSWSHLNSDPPVKHSHALKISRFRQCLDQFETSMFIQDSFSVTVAGQVTHWELRVYPNGYDDENSNYLGIFVKHKEGNSHRYLIKSVIQLLDGAGVKKVPVDLPGKVLSSKQMHGTKKYIEREGLLANSQLYNEDSITFLLEAEICQPGTRTSVVESGASGLSGHVSGDAGGQISGGSLQAIHSRLTGDLLELLTSGLMSDLRVMVGDVTFAAHRNILAARSPVFAAMFSHNMEEQRKNELKITDLPAPVVKAMLEYIYSGKYQESEHTPALLEAADKYDLPELKLACEASLARDLGLTNCLELIVLADTHSAAGLRSAALAFIVRNLTKIVSDAGWQVQLAGHSHLMAQIIQSMANMPRETAYQESSHFGQGPSKKRRRELSSFKEALLSAMCSSDEEEM